KQDEPCRNQEQEERPDLQQPQAQQDSSPTRPPREVLEQSLMRVSPRELLEQIVLALGWVSRGHWECLGPAFHDPAVRLAVADGRQALRAAAVQPGELLLDRDHFRAHGTRESTAHGFPRRLRFTRPGTRRVSRVYRARW